MSTMHTIHADISDVGLVDGCPRCEEHAKHPIRELDLRNLRRLIELACDRSIRPRSDAEAVAAANVLTAMEQFGKIAEADPAMAIDYLKRWGVEVIAFDVGP